MSHTYAHLLVHIVFSTKQRCSLIETQLRTRLYQYFGGIVRNMDCVCLEIGGVADHVHLLVYLRPKHSIADFVREVKASTSRWINESGLVLKRFEWQRGYGVFTVSQSQVEKVQNYIRNQEIHHRQITFEEEFISLLNAHNIKYDPRYVLDDLSPALQA